MAENGSLERDELAREIRIIREWRLEMPTAKVESAFLRLEDLDRSANEDLWPMLQEALSTNKDLSHPEIKRRLADAERAGQGYWWYDPDESISRM